MTGAYYNEFDPFAAQWLRNLISAGHLPAGDVDDRSIVDVRPDDLAGYTQVHFFAGIGGWGHALRLAGWPDSRPIWTGSCPCQPFSNAGKGAGTDDPRHLWPHFFRLIAARRPPVVMGEQVAGSAGYGWLDGVRADLAGEDYASRGVDIPACAVDAPHIRNRLYWVAVANADPGRTRGVESGAGAGAHLLGASGQDPGSHGGQRMADADVCRRDGRPESQERSQVERAVAERADARGSEQLLGDCVNAGLEGHRAGGGSEGRQGPAGSTPPSNVPSTFWSHADRLLCHDGKTRRTQPGVPLLVNGVRGRVDIRRALGQAVPEDESDPPLMNRIGVWKGAGNAIVPQEAEQVIRAYMDIAP